MPVVWAFREPLKQTAPINFASGRLASGAENAEAKDVLRELTRSRAGLLDLLAKYDGDIDVLDKTFKEYLGLLLGLVQSKYAGPSGPIAPPSAASAAPSEPTSAAAPVKEPEAKAADDVKITGADGERIKKAIGFKWSDNFSGTINTMYQAEFEVQCMLLNYALWHMRRSAHLAQQGQISVDVDENSAKTILKSLRVAAGVFQAVDQRQKGKLAYDPNTDYDERLIKGKILQCLAEAQEITLERARQKKHKPELIAQLARHIQEQYQATLDDIKTMEDKDVETLRAYLQFKASFHEAYMLTYWGMKLFSEEKCGESIKAFQQARDALRDSIGFAKKFNRSGYKKFSYHTNMAHDPTDHKLFKELKRDLDIAEEKAVRENGFIYHQKVPTDKIDPCAPKSLVSPEEFVLPPLNALWEKAEFDVKKIPFKGESTTADKAAGDEKEVESQPGQTVKPPKSSDETYCVIS